MPPIKSIDEKYAGTEMEKYLKGPCSNLLRSCYDCLHSSKMLIKGLECVDIFKEYHACCRQATDEELQKRQAALDRRNSGFLSWFWKSSQTEIDPSTITICPSEIVAIENAGAEEDE